MISRIVAAFQHAALRADMDAELIQSLNAVIEAKDEEIRILLESRKLWRGMARDAATLGVDCVDGAPLPETIDKLRALATHLKDMAAVAEEHDR